MELKNNGKRFEFHLNKRKYVWEAGEVKDLEENIVIRIMQRFIWRSWELKKEDIETIQKNNATGEIIFVLKSGKKIVQKKAEELRFNEIQKEMDMSKLQIAIFMKNITTHYSGGRYWSWLLGHILAENGDCQVTFITNELPPFGDSFKLYNKKNIFIYLDKLDVFRMGDKIPSNVYDYVLGIPIEGGVSAELYAKKWNVPYYCLLFESPNFIRDYRGGSDSHDHVFKPYVEVMKGADKIINNTEIGKEYLDTWKLDATSNKLMMGDDFDSSKSVWLWNSINTKVADNVEAEKIRGKEYHIVFVGRAVDFKRTVHIIRALNNIKDKKFILHIISGHASRMIIKLNGECQANVKLEYHEKVDDFEKFKIIKQCSLMLFLSQFEGFGIPPGEALWCRTMCIAYPLPILKLIYKEHLIYAKDNDINDLTDKVKRWLNSSTDKTQFINEAKKYIDTIFSHNRVRNKFFEIVDHEGKKEFVDSKVNIITNVKRLTFGMIVCNGAQFIKRNLEHIYDLADQIIIVEGAVDKFNNVIGSNHSTDNTMAIIKDFRAGHDKQMKIKVFSTRELGRPYYDKLEMQNIIAEHTRGEYFVKQDVDEFYDLKNLLNEIERMDKDRNKLVLNYRSHHFWGDFNHVIVGANFNDKQSRIWRWKNTYKHIRTFNVFTDTENGSLVGADEANVMVSEDSLFHYSYIYENKARAEILQYYKNRDLGNHVDVNDAWNNRQPSLLSDGRKVVPVELDHPISQEVLKEIKNYG